ncbi:sensor histidine kinase [Nocardioides speluncae]|uniref:sensor histidine kinase n=1 Tax=Nocardioides speluncae TaxID=2670337 RepID=UPI000D69B94C|nr:HAMP domain-containing sensor histidine kinase [Nocardioides speluncae]
MSTSSQGDGWHYRRSLASRVTLLTTMAVGLSVAFVALGAYVTARMQMQSALDASLAARTQAAAETGTVAAARGEQVKIPPFILGAADVRLFVVLADGETHVVGDGNALRFGPPEIAVANGKADHSIRTISEDGDRYRVAAWPTGEGDAALVLAQSLEPQDNVLAKLGLVMLLFGGAGVITAGLAGWGVARNGLRPVRRLTDEAERIARTEDLTPLTVEGDDEIARLATAFNSMLSALAASRTRQRQLVADAGHELRTPLTSLRTNLDLLLQADTHGVGLPPEARSELLDDVRAQIQELTTLIGDLVELARDEPLQHLVEPVDLSEVADRAVARVRRRAPGVTFAVDAEPWWLIGESSALERAVTNLLDNAAKWSPVGGVVSLSVHNGVLTVDDQGPGIAEDDLPQVFDRFYRSPESRGMSGSGLGLSIVRQVAHRHGGAVSAGAAPGGGARLMMMLPGQSSEPSTQPAPPAVDRATEGERLRP